MCVSPTNLDMYVCLLVSLVSMIYALPSREHINSSGVPAGGGHKYSVDAKTTFINFVFWTY